MTESQEKERRCCFKKKKKKKKQNKTQNKTPQIKFSNTSASRLHGSRFSIIYRRPRGDAAVLVLAGGQARGQRGEGRRAQRPSPLPDAPGAAHQPREGEARTGQPPPGVSGPGSQFYFFFFQLFHGGGSLIYREKISQKPQLGGGGKRRWGVLSSSSWKSGIWSVKEAARVPKTTTTQARA